MNSSNRKRNIRSLMSRIRAYELLFKEMEKSQKESLQKGMKDDAGTGAPDNQAHTAYMNLIKLVHALEKDNPKVDTGEFQKLTEERVREVLRDVYGI
jgi:hypothetical protein